MESDFLPKGMPVAELGMGNLKELNKLSNLNSSLSPVWLWLFQVGYDKNENIYLDI